MRIGVDVGGTHTDAVLLTGSEIRATTKQATTRDVLSGVVAAVDAVLEAGDGAPDRVDQVMIGTTQFTNAVVERRNLAPTAAIRIGLPSGRGLPPMLDWPDDIAEAVGRHAYQLDGGFLYDGRVLAPLDDAQIDAAIEDIARKGLTNIAVASAFAPVNPAHETEVARRLKRALPGARVTCSHPFGRLGLIERENAAILNAALRPLADSVVAALLGAIAQRGLTCPVYISQNDGTLMSADFVRRFPALTFASGPTNSLRGACRLTGLDDAIVIDIGGTTSDIGVLHNGFVRESNSVVDIGGVRTNFRMPDILPIGLGGGSLVHDDGGRIGPISLGYRLTQDSRVFGGDVLTTTDIVVASGAVAIGNPERVAGLDRALVDRGIKTIHGMLNRGIDLMKPSRTAMPVVLVGGGAVLVSQDLAAASDVHRPQNAGVANAIGAAIAQIGGEAEQLLSYRQTPREEALSMVTDLARQRAILAGADAATLRVADIEETTVPYMDEGATRVRIKVIGDTAMGGRAEQPRG
ncbi:MAG: hydantoinase/oxoprolinase family protein [Pseudomonadota bacterium]